MSDPDARPSEPPPLAELPRPGPAGPTGPARAVAPVADIGQAAEQLAVPLARLAEAVRAARDHLEGDPVRAKGELEEARAALEALRRELATWSRR